MHLIRIPPLCALLHPQGGTTRPTRRFRAGMMMLRIFPVLLLLAVCGASSAAERVSLAVLTFRNLTGDSGQDWIGAAFAEALAVKLTALDQLRILDRRVSARLFRQKQRAQQSLTEADATEAGDITGCQFVLFGAVQAAGDPALPQSPLRVTARLVEVRTGQIGKAIAVDGVMGAMLDLQTLLARNFADLLELKRSAVEDRGLNYGAQTSPEALRFYLQGLEYLDAQEYPQAAEKFTAACAAHPGILYAEAHYALGSACLQSGASQKLLELYRSDAARLSIVFYDLGRALEAKGEPEKALEAYKTFLRYGFGRELERNKSSEAPDELRVWLTVARIALDLGQTSEAARCCDYLWHHPGGRDPTILRQLARLYRRAGEEDSALDLERLAQKKESEASGIHPLPQK